MCVAGSAIWGLGAECRAALGPPASPDGRPLSKRPRLEEDVVPGRRAFVRGHYTVSGARCAWGVGAMSTSVGLRRRQSPET